MKLKSILFTLLITPFLLTGQTTINQEYYLPNIQYNPEIPTPASWLGFEVGDWHATHDQLLGYMKVLAAASDRIEIQEYGRTYENRALVCLTISDPSNLANLAQIKQQRQQLADPKTSNKLNINSLPAVNYMGYSIHGNETSGSNAAFLVAYYLAAGQSQEIASLLKNTVILLDPCFNPDGMQRFSTWVNSHKSKQTNTDPADNEYNEPWPMGRTNHYGFDLNRDWLVAQQPESKGRVALFQEWKPNVLTDHHEMGSNATFFFQPGIPSRVNPITPAKNQELTAKIATYHARLFSVHDVLFYSEENYDDYYYGKGSTYPDVQGAIGILFEQGSSRGTAQETENGLLTFPYSIRNQVFASLSTLKAVADMRVELNNYLREFYTSAIKEAKEASIKGYLFSDTDLPAREFHQILISQGIEVHQLKHNLRLDSLSFVAEKAYFVPCQQPQYRLIRAIFERPTSFQDSIFYDISAWTLPDAFGLEWAELPKNLFRENDFRETSEPYKISPPAKLGSGIPYAYAISGKGYETPKILGKLLASGIKVRVAMLPFEVEGEKLEQGTILVAADRQPVSGAVLVKVMEEISSLGATIKLIENGQTSFGPDLGSNNFEVIQIPKILMATGDGVNVAAAGEIWHLLDTRYEIPFTKVDIDRIGKINLDKYNVLILPEGNYGSLSVEKIKEFAQGGGTIIMTGTAINWLKSSGLAPVKKQQSKPYGSSIRPYGKERDDKGALAMPGAIFEANLDLSHPICFGYTNPKLPVFMADTIFIATGKNPYASPVVLSEKPLLAGYVHPTVLPMGAKAANVIIYGIGRGRVICFSGNPNFRAFWYGTNRMFANAIFFGNLIRSGSIER